MIAKLMPHKYPNYYNLVKDDLPKKPTIVELDDKDVIKPTIEKLLFVEKYNYVLIGYNGSLYICEPDSNKPDAVSFHRREVAYHPHMHVVAVPKQVVAIPPVKP